MIAKMAVCSAVLVVQSAASSFATTMPDYILDVQKREPELSRIFFQAGVDAPKMKDFVGRTRKEYDEKTDEARKAYCASLPPGTADFILAKLNTALAAEPPDLPVVWIAVSAAWFAPDPRICEVAARLLDDLAETGERCNEIAPAAMYLLAGSRNRKYVETVLAFTRLEKLSALEEKGFNANLLGSSAIFSLRALPKDEARKTVVGVSEKLAADLELDKTEAKSRIVGYLQENSVKAVLYNLDLDPNRIVKPEDDLSGYPRGN
jgi:hypothetical protein